MFEYFPDRYPWSMAVVGALDRGANMSEIDRICAPLAPFARSGGEDAINAWVERWSTAAYELRDAARDHRGAGRHATAADLSLRASLYLAVAEGQATTTTPGIDAIYLDSLTCFRDAVQYLRPEVEFLSIPLADGEMPALFVPARGDATDPPPCIIHLNGLDSTKESVYLRWAETISKRGYSSLFLDQPGSGGALRLHGLAAVADAESYVSAAIDVLEGRADIDPGRIVVQGLSMGGYAAPRAAAFEHRLAACTVIGAFFDWIEIAEFSLAKGEEYADSTTDLPARLAWVAGDSDFISVFKEFTLRHVAHQIACPLLVVQGGRDRQIPPDHGEKTVRAATNSPRADLITFDDHLGGVEHCSIDNPQRAIAAVCDWLDEVFERV